MMLPEESNSPLYRKNSITTTLSVVVMLVLFFSCGGKKTEAGEAITERDSLPMMRSYGVTTFISDSGITKYKLIAEEWFVYDKKKPSYWAFEKGAYLEKYDTLFNIESSVKADTAYYFDQQKLWELRSNVEIMNVKGERFETELLFWDEAKGKTYTDKLTRIELTDRIIYTLGLESDQQMINWVMYNALGTFYFDEAQTGTPQSQGISGDSIPIQQKIPTDSIN